MEDDHSWTFRNFSSNFCTRMKSSSTGASTRTSPVLLFRLNVFPIEMPPLRERKDEILILVEYFVQRYASRAGSNIRSIDKKTLNLLQSYDWPATSVSCRTSLAVHHPEHTDVFSVDEL